MAKFRKSGANPVAVLLLLAIVPGLFAVGSWREHQRRTQVLEHGQMVKALVMRSDDKGYKHLCVVAYSFNWQNDAYDGKIVDCQTMERYPKGSLIPVRLNPNDPAGSLAEGDSVWPPYAIVPVLLGVPLLLLVSIFAREYVTTFSRRLRKRSPRA